VYFIICFLPGTLYSLKSLELTKSNLKLTSRRDQNEGVTAFFEKRKPNFKATLEEDAPPSFPWWTETDTGSRPKAAKGQSKL
jgi:hypothetical protein